MFKNKTTFPVTDTAINDDAALHVSRTLYPQRFMKSLRFVRDSRVPDRTTGEPSKHGVCRTFEQVWTLRTENGDSFTMLFRNLEEATKFAAYMKLGVDQFYTVNPKTGNRS